MHPFNLSILPSKDLKSPDEYGTIKRNFTHKGFGKLVGWFVPTEQEIEFHKDIYSYSFSKYKSFDEFYSLRNVQDPEVEEVVNPLTALYPCYASGQLRRL